MSGLYFDELTVGQMFQHPIAGIVTFIHRAFNQRGELVGHCRRSGLQKKKPVA